MNFFNRIMMVLACLILLILVGFVLIQPLDAIDTARFGLTIFEQTVMNEQFYSIFLGVASLILIILLVVLILELRHPRYRTVRVKSKGNVQLDISSVAQSLAYRVDELPGVRQVVPHVISHGNDIEVALDLDTSPSVSVPELTDLVVKMCRDIAETQLGLKVRGKIKVNIRHEPYPGETAPTRTQPSPTLSAGEPAASTSEQSTGANQQS